MISRYFMVQLGVYLVEFIFFSIGVKFVAGHGQILLVNGMVKALSLALAFSLHKYWTFVNRGNDVLFDEIGKYLALFGVHLITASALAGIILLLGAHPEVAKIGSDTICVLITYYLTKTYIFDVKE